MVGRGNATHRRGFAVEDARDAALRPLLVLQRSTGNATPAPAVFGRLEAVLVGARVLLRIG